MTEYHRTGSIVCPIWDKERRGKIVGRDGELCTVKWFEQKELESWHDSNLTFVIPQEKKMYTLKCKPMPNTLEIEEGGWKYVVVNRHTDKIVSAFVSDMDAEQYVQNYPGAYYIREVDNEQ